MGLKQRATVAPRRPLSALRLLLPLMPMSCPSADPRHPRAHPHLATSHMQPTCRRKLNTPGPRVGGWGDRRHEQVPLCCACIEAKRTSPAA